MAIKIAQSESWDQIFFDAKTFRQMPFQALIIGVLDDQNHPYILVVYSCILLTYETTENMIDSLSEKVLFSLLSCMRMLHILSISLTYHTLFLCNIYR